MKFCAWLLLSSGVALVLGLPLVLLGASREIVSCVSLAGGALALLYLDRTPPKR